MPVLRELLPQEYNLLPSSLQEQILPKPGPTGGRGFEDILRELPVQCARMSSSPPEGHDLFKTCDGREEGHRAGRLEVAQLLSAGRS